MSNPFQITEPLEAFQHSVVPQQRTLRPVPPMTPIAKQQPVNAQSQVRSQGQQHVQAQNNPKSQADASNLRQLFHKGSLNTVQPEHTTREKPSHTTPFNPSEIRIPQWIKNVKVRRVGQKLGSVAALLLIIVMTAGWMHLPEQYGSGDKVEWLPTPPPVFLWFSDAAASATYSRKEENPTEPILPSIHPPHVNDWTHPMPQAILTSHFGPRWGRQHQGIDLASPTGSPIQAAAGGTVVSSGWVSGYGKQVVIDHGHGVKTRYAHCSKLWVKKGQTVTQGQRIAAVGSTGHSTGPHLHFEVWVQGKPQNPMAYFDTQS